VEDEDVAGKYPCPCCGHLVFDEPPGSYDICPICFWEDDETQLCRPQMAGGANRVSLIEAQRNYVSFSACDEKATAYVRPPRADETMDSGWRPVSPHVDDVMLSPPYPDDLTTLYYWRRDKPPSR
jgi:hypothetical protein